MTDSNNDSLRQKYIERHRRRHGEKPARRHPLLEAQHFLRKTFNIREGRAPYQVIRRRFVNGARLTGTHLCILVVAMVIACIGLDLDSDIAIVGAMLICPLMGSVLALAYSAATLDRALARDALGGLVLQMVFCLVTSTIYFRLSPIAGMTPALIDNSTPTAWDLLLALVGGFAGGLGNSRDQEPATLISGVAVATALMPPLCSAGYGLAFLDASVALSALYEFGINVVFIALAANLVLLLLRVPLRRDIDGDGVVTEAEELTLRGASYAVRHLMVVGTLIFAIPCLFFTVGVVRQESHAALSESDHYGTAETARELAVACPGFREYTVGVRSVSSGRATGEVEQRLVARVKTSEPLTQGERAVVEGLIRLDVPELDGVEFVAASQ